MTFNTDRETDRETDRHAGMPVVILHTCVRGINSNKRSGQNRTEAPVRTLSASTLFPESHVEYYTRRDRQTDRQTQTDALRPTTCGGREFACAGHVMRSGTLCPTISTAQITLHHSLKCHRKKFFFLFILLAPDQRA